MMNTLKALGITLLVAFAQFLMITLGLFLSVIWDLSLLWTGVVTTLCVWFFQLILTWSSPDDPC